MPTDPRFVASLFEPDDLVEVRALGGRGKTRVMFCKARELISLDAKLDHLNNPSGGGFNIYAGANPRKREGGKATDVSLGRCLFVDIDHVDRDAGRQRLRESGLPMPTLTVFSGHGMHAYWRLDEPIYDLTEWTTIQQALIRLLQSDKVIHDPPRIMRLPGFMNHKEPSALCEVIEADPSRRFAFGDFAAFEGIEASEGKGVDASKLASAVSVVSVDSKGSADSEDSAVSVTPPAGPRMTPQQVIDACIPCQIGVRERCLFELARGLKFNAGLATAGLGREVKAFVRAWYQIAEPIIGTKGFDTSWVAFGRAWDRARLPLGTDPVGEAFQLALEQEASKCLPRVAMEYDDRQYRLVVAICANLASSKDRVFFLSSHSPGLLPSPLSGMKPMEVHRLLGMLVSEKHLALVAKGSKWRATRYRWIASNEA